MFNKNDPLIGVVQQVMQKSNAERDAVKAVNEKFGVQDRKALPHEKQAEWTAAYNQVLSEGKITHPNQQRLDVHEPEKDELTKKDFEMLRSKKKTVKEEEALEEREVNPYAVGMAAVKKSTGDEPPMEKKNIMKAHKIAKKIIAKKKMNEGFNDRHGSNDAGVAGQLTEAPKARSDYGLGAIPAQKDAAQRRANIDKAMEPVVNVAKAVTPGASSFDKISQGDYKGAAIDAAIDIAGGAAIGGALKAGKAAYKFMRGGSKIAAGAETAAAAAKPVTKAARETQQSVPSIAKGSGQANRLAAPTGPGPGKGPWGTPNTPAAQAAAQAVKKNTARVNAVRREVPGAQSVKPSAPVTPKTQSGVPSIAQGKGRVGPSKVERTGPWNPVGPKAPAKPGAAPNAAAATASKLSARQRFAQTAKDIRAGVGKVASDRPLQAAAVGGAALGIAKATQSQNTPAPASAALAKQQSAKIGNQTGGVNNASAAKTQPATKPVTAKPASATPAANKPVVKATPKVNPLQSKTQRDDIAGPGGTGKVVGGVTSGKVTGKTITNKPQVAKKAPVGTGRVK